MEKSYIYEVTPDLSDLNENGFLKPYAYQNLFAKIAEEHLSKIDLNMDTTIKYNLAWALISLSFEIVSPVRGIGKLFAQTWHSGKKGPYYRRELVFKNSEGDILGSTFSILLDLNTGLFIGRRTLSYRCTYRNHNKAQPTFKSDIGLMK